MRKLAFAILAGLLLSAQSPVLPGFPPGVFSNYAVYDPAASACETLGSICPNQYVNFSDGTAWSSAALQTVASMITITRTTTNATNLLPTSASGASYSTFGAGVLPITSGLGILVEEARNNSLLNSTVPATQTTGSLANGTYTLWVNGSGSAVMSPGTATGCGVGTATNGSPVNFTTSGAAGTCIVTVVGSLNAFQLELGAYGTSLIVTAGATGTRNAANVTWTFATGFVGSGGWLSVQGQLRGVANVNYLEGPGPTGATITTGTGGTTVRMINRNGATSANRGDNGGNGPTISNGVSFKSAMYWNGTNTPLYSVNNTTVATSTTTTENDWSTSAKLGSRGGSSLFCNCYIALVAYGTNVLNQTQANAVTQ